MTPKQSRPGGRSQAAGVAFDGTTILGDLDALAAFVDGAFVVLVQVNASRRPVVLADENETVPEVSESRRAPSYRRRVFLSAAAAERAARAAVGRGETVRVYLAQLAPLHRLAGCEGGQQ